MAAPLNGRPIPGPGPRPRPTPPPGRPEAPRAAPRASRGTRPALLGAGSAVALFAAGSLLFVHEATRYEPSQPRAAAPPAPATASPAPLIAAAPAPRAVEPPAAPRPTVPPPDPAAPRAAKPAPAAKPPAPAGTPTVAFRLDRRLTRGVHLGDRWVSPPVYEADWDGKLFQVDARSRGRGETTWIALHPDMLDVSPHQGERVTISVLRPGETRLTVSRGGASRTLVVTVDEHPRARVTITQ